MRYDPEIDGPLRSGAVDEEALARSGEYDISPAQAARIAAEILADPHATDAYVDDGGVVKSGPRRNRHLDGDGYGVGR